VTGGQRCGLQSERRELSGDGTRGAIQEVYAYLQSDVDVRRVEADGGGGGYWAVAVSVG
jgi:hypothetical protein